jgi:hypothetical protein
VDNLAFGASMGFGSPLQAWALGLPRGPVDRALALTAR